jgi:hypothetical protein
MEAFAKLNGLRGEGTLRQEGSHARGTLRFPRGAARELEALARVGAPATFEGVLLENGLATRIYADVYPEEAREHLAGVDLDVVYGTIPRTPSTSFRFVG